MASRRFRGARMRERRVWLTVELSRGDCTGRQRTTTVNKGGLRGGD
jgi:hypothetical protein